MIHGSVHACTKTSCCQGLNEWGLLFQPWHVVRPFTLVIQYYYGNLALIDILQRTHIDSIMGDFTWGNQFNIDNDEEGDEEEPSQHVSDVTLHQGINTTFSNF